MTIEKSFTKRELSFHSTSCWGYSLQVAKFVLLTAHIQGLVLLRVKPMPNLPLHHWTLNDGCIVVVMDANHHPGNEWKKLVLI